MPVLKSVDRVGVINYRRISILPNFAKAFEQILYQEIHKYIVNIGLTCQPITMNLSLADGL